ncbi:MAG: methyltransferase domain-containing protein [Actinobacteria bacterium]|nr:methyltransferase domain-containing protein [Actinomycetota bacterium]
MSRPPDLPEGFDLESVSSGAFGHVDDSPFSAEMIAGMDRLSGAQAVVELRRWSIDSLSLHPGQRVLEVGCGPGDMSLVLADAVGTAGAVNGLDNSRVMIAEAKRRAAHHPQVQFDTGDAQELLFGDSDFDACYSERVFQHLDAPELALKEMLRVLRPGGRVVVVDTDWETVTIDHPDVPTTRKILNFVTDVFTTNGWIGRRLPRLFRDNGLKDVSVTARSLLVPEWDADTDPSAIGPPFFVVLPQAQERGVVTKSEADQWLAELEKLAQEDRFFASLTMFGVCATKPQ